MTQLNLDTILLRHDQRGISPLREYLPAENYLQTARFILENPGRVLLATGFYVAGIAETDGPPGALVLARALKKLGYQVGLVSDCYCLPLLENLLDEQIRVFDFPLTDDAHSRELAVELLEEFQPQLLISIERCGLTSAGEYHNMHGADITPFTARLDYLFSLMENTIGIGDGGNEIGMGQLYEQISEMPELTRTPSTTSARHLLISSVSNWAAYGLVAALSELSGIYLLPEFEQIWGDVEAIVARGSKDGVTKEVDCRVDGFSKEINQEIVGDLHAYLKDRIGK